MSEADARCPVGTVGTIGTVADHADGGGEGCADLPAPRTVAPSSRGCEDCVTEGRAWASLRVCLTCGRVGCCDNSPGRHATAHHDRTGHPVITSAEPGERWQWCFTHATSWAP